MTRFLAVALLSTVIAAAPPPPKRTTPPKMVTLTGEILDMGCYLSRGLRGELHRDCALKCIHSGIPMGLATADSTIYLLTQNHDRAMDPKFFPPPDPYEVCKLNAARQMIVSGWIWERDGIKEFEVKAAKVAPAPPPATP
ncbi:MAG TPA: hypothetical protein VF363_10875 [Candidatus Eisenbacteria bacterium]